VADSRPSEFASKDSNEGRGPVAKPPLGGGEALGGRSLGVVLGGVVLGGVVLGGLAGDVLEGGLVGVVGDGVDGTCASAVAEKASAASIRVEVFIMLSSLIKMNRCAKRSLSQLGLASTTHGLNTHGSIHGGRYVRWRG
jgi:hypothetical protein